MNQTRGVDIFAKLILTACVLILCTQTTLAASLDDLLKQKDQLTQQLDQAQSAAQNKGQEAKTLSTQITNLDKDIKATEDKISETGGQINTVSQNIESLSKDLDQKNAELVKLKTKLNNALIEIYRFSSRSSWELILSGDSLGSNSNEAKYVEAIEIQVKTIHTQVQQAKDDLEKQKSDLEAKKAELDSLKSQQEAYKKGTEYQKNQKDKILGMTVQQKASYEDEAKKLQSEITHISSEIYAQRKKGKGKEVLLGGGSGYPYSSIDEPDAWGFLTSECTSYAAWYMNVINGKDFVNTRPGQGSAYNWSNLAQDQGFSVSSSPRKGAIISWGAGPLTSGWGHVAVVEAVNGDGTIDISEYNWNRYSYSYRKNVNPGDYGSYNYIW
ncbi:MAG: CHAP domain-containing protein [Candidatus Berkelbacteria bacterium]|nr:CHAP domain-containing protein [Candidatus Berkelbacteria bacterium]